MGGAVLENVDKLDGCIGESYGGIEEGTGDEMVAVAVERVAFAAHDGDIATSGPCFCDDLQQPGDAFAVPLGLHNG